MKLVTNTLIQIYLKIFVYREGMGIERGLDGKETDLRPIKW